MRKRNNPIPLEQQRHRHIGFADENVVPRYSEFSLNQRIMTMYDPETNFDAYYRYGGYRDHAAERVLRNCNDEIYQDLDLRHICFNEGVFTRTSFINCDLRGCSFNDAHLVDTNFEKSDLSHVHFLEAFIRRVKFNGADLRRVNFYNSNADFQSCIWDEANLTDTAFKDSKFALYLLKTIKEKTRTFFGLPNFSGGTDLSNADLQGIELVGVDLSWHVNLQNSNLQGANLQAANLDKSFLQGANLQGANLQGANLKRTNLQGANLKGANLRDATYNEFTVGLTDTQKSEMVYVEFK